MEIVKQIISSVSLAWCGVVLNSKEKDIVSCSIKILFHFYFFLLKGVADLFDLCHVGRFII